MSTTIFNQLSPNFPLSAQHQSAEDAQAVGQLWHKFYQNADLLDDIQKLTAAWRDDNWQTYRQTWQELVQHQADDRALTDWLIALFNHLFNNPDLAQMPTILVRGGDEPEYFAGKQGQPARIEFAHGYFASALHEISHWCIAGKQRRTLDDFGYWYEADGRDEEKQKLFEQVEIKPQAVECLLTLACGRYFYVSQDNLNANFDTSASTFTQDVFDQAKRYLAQTDKLPRDAGRLLWVFLTLCQNDF